MDPERAKLIDELGAVSARLAPHAEDIARQTNLKQLVRTWPALDQIPADATKAYLGSKYSITLGAAEKLRIWKPSAKSALYALLKKARFLAMCNVTLKAATEAVGEAAVADLVVSERTGSRPLIVAERTK